MSRRVLGGWRGSSSRVGAAGRFSPPASRLERALGWVAIAVLTVGNTQAQAFDGAIFHPAPRMMLLGGGVKAGRSAAPVSLPDPAASPLLRMPEVPAGAPDVPNAPNPLNVPAGTNYTVTRFDDTSFATLEPGAGYGPGNAGDLRYELFAAMAEGGAATINFQGCTTVAPCKIVLGAPLPPIFEATSNTGATAPASFQLTIDGGAPGAVFLDGNSQGTNTTTGYLASGYSTTNRVFFVDNVAVTLKNLVIQNATAQGGAGGSGEAGGGGGAGFGAGVFVNQATASVFLQGITFLNCSVAGGAGGGGNGIDAGGGGGLGFAGGNGSSANDGTGGGVAAPGMVVGGYSGGTGGAGGGGGGSGNGYAGGPGGAAYAANNAGGTGGNGSGGSGGFGGGGAAAESIAGGNGGFGGGGGGTLEYGGDGGFGGGGGGIRFLFASPTGSGGTVGGITGGSGNGFNGGQSGGGGGAAAGPAIFVVSGSITILESNGVNFAATPGSGATASALPVFNYAGKVNGSTTVGPLAAPLPTGVPATNVGTTSSTTGVAVLTFATAVASGTAFTTNVLTQGVAGQDFASVSGGTCTSGTAYAAGATCTVNFSFKPTAPGARMGAVTLTTAGGALATTYINAIGLGPQVTFTPGTITTLAMAGTTAPAALAVDAAGNAYVGQTGSVVKVTPSGTVTTVASNSGHATGGVAVDGAGNLYFSDTSNYVYKVDAVTGVSLIYAGGGGTTATGDNIQATAANIATPEGLAVDGAGNLYIGDGSGIRMVNPSGVITTPAGGSGTGAVIGLAIDPSGDLFYSNNGQTVYELSPAGVQTTIASPSSHVNGVATDAAGDVYMTSAAGYVYKWTLTTGAVTVVAGNGQQSYTGDSGPATSASFSSPYAAVPDGAGNLLISDQSNNAVRKVTATPATVSFANTVAGNTSSSQTVIVNNIGNEVLTVPPPSSGQNPSLSTNFTQSGSSTCPLVYSASSAQTLGYGTTCTEVLSFAPTTPGTITGSLLFTDNNLNGAGATQSVPLGGTATQAPPTVTSLSPTSGPVAGGASVTIAGTNLNGTTAVTFGGTSATITADTAASLTVTSPSHAVGAVDVVVTTPGGSVTDSSAYTYSIPVPTVTAIAPTSGPAAGGTSVTVTGTNFTGASGVKFGAVAATSFTVNSATSITAIAPAGTGVVDVTVTNSGGTSATSSADSFAYLAPSVYTAPTEPVGTASTAQVAYLTFTTAGTPVVPAAANVLTLGAANRDFQFVSTTCTATAYTAGQSCTVSYLFKPLHPGQRLGAIVLSSSSGTPLATTLLNGIGTGPQAYFPGNSNVNTLPSGTGFKNPAGVAVDGAGDIFVADTANGAVKEIVAQSGAITSSSTVITIASGFINPVCVAVDGAGDVFVTDYGHTAVKEIVAVGGLVTSSSTVITVGSDFSYPEGVAVDGAGDVFVADTLNNVVKEIVAAGGAVTANSAVITVASGFYSPYGVAVDAAGDVFVADASHNAVKEIVAVGGVVSTSSTINTVGSGFSSPAGVAVDAAGDVFVADVHNNAIKEIVAVGGMVSASSTVNTLGSGFSGPTGVAVDAAGDVFVADYGHSAVEELLLAMSPAINFPTTTAVGSTDTTDGTLSVTLGNDGNATMTVSSIAPSTTSFTFANSTCTSLAEGATCSIGATFTPQSAGMHIFASGYIEDDSLNGTSSEQSVDLEGTAVPAVPTVTGISPSNGSTAGGTSIIITGTNFTGATAVSFGATAATSFTVNSATSITATSPAGAGTVDVTVKTAGGTSTTSSTDHFTYVSAPAVTGITPTAGPVTGGTSVTVTGTNLTGASGVKFGTVAATSFTVNSATSMTAIAPSGTGVVDVTVTNSGGTSATTSADRFTYVTAPVVSGISPTSGTTAGGTAVTITGSNFTGATAVMFGAVSATTYTVNSATQITATSPAGTGVVDVTVTGSGGTSATSSADRFAYLAPSVYTAPTEPVGTASATQIATLTFTAAGTPVVPTSANVLTMGAPNKDFQFVSTTCTATAYTVNQSCTVSYLFKPLHPGQRLGAIVLSSSSGTPLATTFLNGIGTGPQAYFPGNSTVNTVGSGFSAAYGVSVDGAGDVFVADFEHNAVKEIVAVGGVVTASSTVITVGNGFSYPEGVAVDGAGNVFVADTYNFAIKEIVAVGGVVTANSTVNTVASGLSYPSGVAVDGAGDVFATDTDNNAVKEIMEVGGAVTANSTVTTVGSGFYYPSGVAVDAAGDVFVADYGHNAVKQIVAVGGVVTAGSTVNTVGSGFSEPSSVAVDAAGDVFVADRGNSAAKEIVAVGGVVSASSTVNTLSSVFYDPSGVAVDGTGNVFVADLGHNAVKELPLAAPPSVTFPTSTAVGSTDTTDGTLSVILGNDGNATMTVSAIAPSTTSFTFANSACTSLAEGATCSIGSTFMPQSSGSPVTANGNITDNSLNVTGAIQAVPLSGTARAAVATVTGISPSNGSTAGGIVVVITGTNFTGATAVSFGATAATSFTISSATSITATSPAGTGTVDVTVTTPGGTSATSPADQFTYVPAPVVSGISPASGATSGGTSVTITGTNLQSTSAVTFGGIAATVVSATNAQLVVTTPAHAAGAIDVAVTTAYGSTTASGGYTYVVTTGAIAFSNLGANQITLGLQASANGTGYFTLLAGGASCGTAAQTVAGQDSTGTAAARFGSLPLMTNVAGSYTVTGLPQSTAYAVCYTPDGSASPVTSRFITNAQAAYPNPVWASVGSTAYSLYGPNPLAFGPDGTPYISFSDTTNSNKATVARYSGGSWTAVGGAGFTTGEADYQSLATAPDGSLYIAYTDFGPTGGGGKIAVMRYAGTAWSYVGTPHFSVGTVSDNSLAFGPDGTPYVAYSDYAGTQTAKVTVMKYSGGTWTPVGAASLNSLTAGQDITNQLVFASNGTLNLISTDVAGGGVAFVAKFDGVNTWSKLGNGPVSSKSSSFATLAFNAANVPYVAFQDDSPSAKADVVTFANGAWTTAGNADFSPDEAISTSIAIAPDGTPTVAYEDYQNNSKATVMKLVGSAWTTVGNADFGNANSMQESLAFAPDGTPYVAFQDPGLALMRLVQPPYVITNAATGVTASAATLNATVQDFGFNTTLTFQYGTTTSYGTTLSATTGGTIAAGTGTTASSVSLAGLSPNTLYHVRAVATGGGYTINGNDITFTTTVGAATHFNVSAPANATAGTAFNVTVTAQDSGGNAATGYSGSIHFTSTDSAATLPTNATLTNGVGTFSVTLKTSGAQTITATDMTTLTITGTSSSVLVAAGTATHFSVTVPGGATAGTAINVTVTALDSGNNTVSGYTGTVHFTSTDSAATLPANTTLPNGTGTFSVTLKMSGSQTITATDTAGASISGTSSAITVGAGTATHFGVVAPGTATAGAAVSVAVAALDANGNTVTGYAGTVKIGSSDAAAMLPVAAGMVNGVGSFQITLKTVGNQTVTAADTATASINGTSSTIVVSAGAVTHFTVSAPSAATAGTAITATVTALDASGNTVMNYAGTMKITSSDAAAVLPANTALSNGAGSVTITLKTPGSQTITATDASTASTTGTSGAINVSAGAATHLSISVPASALPGTAFSVTVTALDAVNNIATGYTGSVKFASTDSAATLAVAGPLTNGSGMFSITLKTAGSQTITATDTTTSSLTVTSSNIQVNAGAATHFTVSAPALTTAGGSFAVTVTALDAAGNTATGYTGTVKLSSTDTAAVLPVGGTLTNGTGVFNVTLKTVGMQTVAATDTAASSIAGTSGTISVSAGVTTHFSVTAPGTATAGAAINATVTALDASGNTVTGYAGTVKIGSSDAAATLPATAALTNGIGSFAVTLKTAGNQIAMATDTVTASINGMSNSIIVGAGAVTHFAVSAPSNATAGTSISATVTALDGNGNTTTNYAGTVKITSSDAAATLPTNAALSNGVGSFTVTLKTSGVQALTATDATTASITGVSNSINVSAGAITHLTISSPLNASPGVAFNATVTALDALNNTATGYTGSVKFTSTDPAATLASTGPLTNGTGTFSMTLRTTGNQTITATDTATASLTATSGAIQVNAGAATHFSVSAPGAATSGSAFTVTVTALDASNNTATGYAGAVKISSTDAAAVIPANATLTSGLGTFFVTLKTVGNQTVTATDTASSSVSGTSGTIVVGAGVASHFSVAVPASATAGTAVIATVTALDAAGNAASSYSGTVRITSSDAAAMLPPNSTLTNGVGVFAVVLKTAGTQTVAATDTSTSITGVSSSIAVVAGGVASFSVTAPGTAAAGAPFTFTVKAVDANGNTVVGYAGTVHFSSTDSVATLPANAPLTSGIGSFQATLSTSGTQTLSAIDTASASIAGVSSSIVVATGTATHYTITVPSAATSGTAISVTVTAKDAANNTVTGYAGTVHFTSSDSSATLSANSVLTSGVGVFLATLKTPGSQTITATDTVTAITATSAAINVSAGAVTHFAVSAPVNAVSGTAFNVLVTAMDASNNTVPGYAGTVHFTSTDGAATLPANATLTNGVGSFPVTLKVSGSQTVTATDTSIVSIAGTSGTIMVAAGVATHLNVSAPSGATAGTSFNVTVTALDAANNTATQYTGTVHFTSSDSAATLPANATLVSGFASFSVMLKTGGNQTLTATDTATSTIVGTSGNIVVGSSMVTHFAVSAPSSATAGAAFSFTVTALDASNNTVTGYTGIAHFASTDGAATLPANAGLTNGVATLTATLRTSGSQTIMATDISSGSINGISAPILVSANAATHFTVTAPSTAVAGTAFSFTVSALDSSNNIVTGYAGTVHFSSTDGAATLPANATLTSGVGSFVVTLKTLGAQTVAATDTIAGSISGSSGSILVGAGATTHFVLGAPVTTTSGALFSVTVTAKDSLNNTVTTYNGTAVISSTDAAATLPAAVMFVNGVGAFNVTLATIGAQTFTATDKSNIAVTGTSASISVTSIAPTIQFAIANPTYGDAPFAVNATSNSSGTFSYKVLSGPATITAPNTVTLTGSGQVQIQTNQAAGGNYTAGYLITTFNVLAGTDNLTFTIQGHTYGDAPFTVMATSPSTGAITYTLVSGPATLAGNTVTLTGAGSVMIGASQVSAAPYLGATQQTKFVVAKATPFISWTAPAAISYGTALSSTQLDASVTGVGGATLTGSFVYTPAAGVVPQPPSQTLSVQFTPVDTANYNTATANIQLAVNDATLTVSANDATRVYGLPNLVLTGMITGQQNGDNFIESFTTLAKSTSDPGGYPIVPAATGPNLSDYMTVIHNGTLTITKANTITTLSVSNQTPIAGQAFAITATIASVTSGTPTGSVQFYDNGSPLGTPATMAGGVALLTNLSLTSGQHAISSSYSGDIDFNPGTAGTSTSLPITLTPPDFTFQLTSSALVSVPFGQPAKFTFHIAPITVPEYNGPVVFTYSAPSMPLDGKITFSPGTVGVNAGPADVTLTLSTPQLSLNQQLEQHPGSTGGALLALLLLPFGLRRKLRHKAGMYRLTMVAFVAFLGLGAMASMTGCGSGIPAGDFPIAVTANAGGVVHTIQVVVHINHTNQ